MIVYRELSSLVSDLGFSAKTLYSVSNTISAHYTEISIPKGNGEYRQLSVPDQLLKSIQTRINEVLLPLEPISPYASAYRPGASTKNNALPHVGKAVILKLDIRHFFDRLIYSVVKEKAFPAARYSEQNRILLSILCTHDNGLPQGAPTSPTISNIIMRDFDYVIGQWCEKRQINYTRYCDDMTFSSDFSVEPVVCFVKKELRKLGLFLNEKKTRIVYNNQRQYVTGIVVNEKMSIPTEYKKRIRQEIYYCRKYSVVSHIKRQGLKISSQAYRTKLLGKINYVLSVEPENNEMRKYRDILINSLKTLS